MSKVLTKENFDKYWHESTGIVYFPNPFDYDGEERERLKTIALSKITRVYSGEGDVFGFHGNPNEFSFVEDGTFSDMVKCLINYGDTEFDSTDDYTLIEFEDIDNCFLQGENNIYFAFE